MCSTWDKRTRLPFSHWPRYSNEKAWVHPEPRQALGLRKEQAENTLGFPQGNRPGPSSTAEAQGADPAHWHAAEDGTRAT